MADNGQVTQSLEHTVQSRVRQDGDSGGFDIMSMLVRANDIIAPWWSQRRDRELRAFWKRGDHLAGAVYAVQTRISTMTFHIVPRDMSIKSHVRQADMAHEMLLSSNFGGGWDEAINPFLEDFLCVDNGGFLEVIGDGPKDGPILGQPVGVASLDSCLCRRTRNPEYPVVYTDTDGQRYKLHRSRVIAKSQMRSPDARMNGVGFSSVSRAIHVAQNLIDISRYKQEKLGSRPLRQMMIGRNISAEEIYQALSIANSQMDDAGLDRYAQTVVIGHKTKEIGVDRLDLASVPDGYDEETAITLGMFTIALAFGVDARELWPASTTGATKADAMIQHLKARGKTIGYIVQMLEREFNNKVLPRHLKLVFDEQDDEQDAGRADIARTRSETRERDIQNGVITVRVSRERMLNDGEITDNQFDAMELEDGRLPDGVPVLSLFQSPDERVQELLRLDGFPAPLESVKVPSPELIDAIERAIWRNQQLLFASTNQAIHQMIEQCIAALEMLRVQAGETAAQEDDDLSTKEIDPVIPIGTNSPLPDVPSEDALAEDAEDGVDTAIDVFDEMFPDWEGLLDAEIIEQKELSKQAGRYSYDLSTFRYRDKQTGRFVAESSILDIRDQYEELRKPAVRDLARQLSEREISLQGWVLEMRQEVKTTYINQYVLARGGRNAMTQADWGRLGQMLRTQYEHLNNFAGDIAAGQLSEAQIGARSEMYIRSSTQAYERGKTEGAHGMPSLPQYPGDGNQICRSNCQCTWDIVEVSDEWRCTWTRHAEDSCDTCIDNASIWNPLIISKPG